MISAPTEHSETRGRRRSPSPGLTDTLTTWEAVAFDPAAAGRLDLAGLQARMTAGRRIRAVRWAAYANDGLPDGSPNWTYLLIGETDLREAKEDWLALKKLAQ